MKTQKLQPQAQAALGSAGLPETSPGALPPAHALLQMQKNVGNRAVAQLMRTALARRGMPMPATAPPAQRSPKVAQRALDLALIQVGDKIREEDNEAGTVYTIKSIDQKTGTVVAAADNEEQIEFEAGGWEDSYQIVQEAKSTVEQEREEERKFDPDDRERQQTSVAEQQLLEQLALRDEPGLQLKDFRKACSIEKGASPFILPLSAPIDIQPQETQKPGSPIAYVANILTIPGDKDVQHIIDTYAAQGVGEANYGSFAMVIGVNLYRSVSGLNEEKIMKAAASAAKAPFPCVIVPFMWDFNWSVPFPQVKEMYERLGAEEKPKALAYEKEHLVQSIIPYGQLREAVTAHPATLQFVSALSKSHKAVYIHSGDDDAPSLFPASGKPQPLLDRYTARIEREKELPRLVVGGYEFRAQQEGGDIDVSREPSEWLAILANRIDIWMRELLTHVNPELVYPTEPNLAFLAAEGKRNYLEEMLSADKQQQKRLEKEAEGAWNEKQYDQEQRPVKPVFTNGLLYGRGANEGGRLRERIKENQETGVKKAKAPKSGKSGASDAVTLYDPGLALATASKRFTLNDRDHVRHEKSEVTYDYHRSNALEKQGPKAFAAQVVDDLLTIKQSHIGGLKKELDGAGLKKNAQSIASDVYACVKAYLLDEELPKTGKEAEEYIKPLLAQITALNEVKGKLHQVIGEMLDKRKQESRQ